MGEAELERDVEGDLCGVPVDRNNRVLALVVGKVAAHELAAHAQRVVVRRTQDDSELADLGVDDDSISDPRPRSSRSKTVVSDTPLCHVG